MIIDKQLIAFFSLGIIFSLSSTPSDIFGTLNSVEHGFLHSFYFDTEVVQLFDLSILDQALFAIDRRVRPEGGETSTSVCPTHNKRHSIVLLDLLRAREDRNHMIRGLGLSRTRTRTIARLDD